MTDDISKLKKLYDEALKAADEVIAYYREETDRDNCNQDTVPDGLRDAEDALERARAALLAARSAAATGREKAKGGDAQ